jgi:hypothetical protein
MSKDGFTINDGKEYNENILLAIIREIEKEDGEPIEAETPKSE